MRQDLWQQTSTRYFEGDGVEISEKLNAVVVNMDEWCSGHLRSAAGISSLLLHSHRHQSCWKRSHSCSNATKATKYAVEVGGFFFAEKTTKCSRYCVQWSILPASLMSNLFRLTHKYRWSFQQYQCSHVTYLINTSNGLEQLHKLASV